MIAAVPDAKKANDATADQAVGAGVRLRQSPRRHLQESPLLALLAGPLDTTGDFGDGRRLPRFLTQLVHRVAGYNTFWDGWEYNIAFTLPVIPMLRRSRRSPDQRVAWRLLALGVVLNTVATLVYTYHDQNLVPIPSPAPSDGFYLASYAMFIIGVAMLTQRRLGRVHASVRLDGRSRTAMASLAGMLWFEPLLKVSGHPRTADHRRMAYPLTDLVLLVLLIAGLAPNRYRPNWSTAFLMAGVLCWVIGDVIYLKQQAAGTYVQSTILDCTWPFGVFLMGLASSTNDRRRSRDLRVAENATYDITLMPVGADCCRSW